MKKAQGISVNVIIIAAIALLVLVVLSVIFIGRMGGWGQKTNDCITNGGNCDYSASEGCPAGTYTRHPTWSCEKSSNPNNICCIQLET